VRPMFADARTIRRNRDHRQAIGLPEFTGGFTRGAGHSRQAMEAAEETLEAQARDRFSGIGDWDVFLGFDGLMHSLTPVALRHRATREFIHDDDLFFLDDVLFVA